MSFNMKRAAGRPFLYLMYDLDFKVLKAPFNLKSSRDCFSLSDVETKINDDNNLK